jgi:hypothetical protein
MKKVIFRMVYLWIVLFIPLSSIAQYSSEKADSDSVFYSYVKKSAVPQNAWLYSYPTTVNGKTKIFNILNEEIITPETDSHLYFIDEEPFSNWTHRCQLVFINVKTRGITSIRALNPPQHLENWKMLSVMPKSTEVKLYDNASSLTSQSSTLIPMSVTPQHRYAIILSGGADLYNNWVRYWNDCSTIFSTLRTNYSFPQDHIYVLMSDGNSSANDRHLNNGNYDSSPLDLNSDGVNDIQYSATAANINTIFGQLSSVLTCQDFLFIYTTDHGGQTSGNNVYMYLWGETMTDVAFATQVNRVNPGYMSIVMEQCNSGGFIDNLSAANRVITTACTASQSSHATSDLNYDEFVYHWTASIRGSYPSGTTVNADQNGDGLISMSEAFSYAVSHDAYTSTETPQISSNYSNLSQDLTLRGNDFCSVKISGPFLVCNSGTTYSITNLPAGYTPTWNSSSNIAYSSGQGTNSYRVVPTGTAGYGYLGASISNGCISSTLSNYTNVWSGKFESTSVSGTAAVCPNSLYSYTAQVPGGHVTGYSYTWSYPSGWSNNGQNQNTILLKTPQYNMTYGSVRVSVTNCNGASGYSGITVYPRSGCSGYFSIYPNPASDIITISLIGNSDASSFIDTSKIDVYETRDITAPFIVNIYNRQGILVLKVNRSGNTFTVPIGTIPDGNYIVELINGNTKFTQLLIVKRN